MKLPNITAALVAVVPAPSKPEAAPFAGLCRSLAKRKAQVTEEFYLGATLHLFKKFCSFCDDDTAFVLSDGDVSDDALYDARDRAKKRGDIDAIAMCDLLLTLSDEQRGRAL